jgi:acyl-coenzyme A synthetase/AMP-(fatty) acid ligase
MRIETSNEVLAGGSKATWTEHATRAKERFKSIEPEFRSRRLAFITRTPQEAIEAVALAATSELDFSIVAQDRVTSELSEVLAEAGIAEVESGTIQGGCSTPTPGRVCVLTSGTTGIPKPVEHLWHTLNTMDRARDVGQRTWFVPYQVGSYAWFQMICLGLFTPRQNLVLADGADPISSFTVAMEAGVTAVSSTPTFWRYAMLKIAPEAFRKSSLETITLGGEIVDQELLDELKRLFPRAAVRHIYASSEAGAAIVVNDGLAGFPVERLQEAGSSVHLKVESGRLHVRSAYTTASSLGQASRWVDTGDLVEVRGDRVYFLGRESGLINVGGLKVMPAEIESGLLEHPDVLWAQVRGRKAPVVGEVPAAKVVLRRSGEPCSDEARLTAHLSKRLPPHAIPRAWKFLPDIPLEPNQKSRQ